VTARWSRRVAELWVIALSVKLSACLQDSRCRVIQSLARRFLSAQHAAADAQRSPYFYDCCRCSCWWLSHDVPSWLRTACVPPPFASRIDLAPLNMRRPSICGFWPGCDFTHEKHSADEISWQQVFIKNINGTTESDTASSRVASRHGVSSFILVLEKGT